jgi:TolB-like protein
VQWLGCLVSAALVSAGVTPPDRDDGTTIGVLEPAFEGPLSDAQKRDFRGAVAQALERAGFVVTAPDAVAKRTGVTTCPNAECLAQVASTLGTDYVVGITVSLDEKDYDFSAQIVDGKTGGVVSSSEERCELCGHAEALDVAAAQAISLQQRIASVSLGSAEYTIVSTPPGARVYIDGDLVGTTPLDLAVEPGVHRASVRLRRHRDQTRDLVAVAGMQEQLKFELVRTKGSAAWQQDPLGSALVGVGGVLFVAGISFVVAGFATSKVRPGSTEGDYGDRFDRASAVYVTGATMAPIGAAIAVGGLVRYILQARRAKRSAATRAAARH